MYLFRAIDNNQACTAPARKRIGQGDSEQHDRCNRYRSFGGIDPNNERVVYGERWYYRAVERRNKSRAAAPTSGGREQGTHSGKNTNYWSSNHNTLDHTGRRVHTIGKD